MSAQFAADTWKQQLVTYYLSGGGEGAEEESPCLLRKLKSCLCGCCCWLNWLCTGIKCHKFMAAKHNVINSWNVHKFWFPIKLLENNCVWIESQMSVMFALIRAPLLPYGLLLHSSGYQHFFLPPNRSRSPINKSTSYISLMKYIPFPLWYLRALLDVNGQAGWSCQEVAWNIWEPPEGGPCPFSHSHYCGSCTYIYILHSTKHVSILIWLRRSSLTFKQQLFVVVAISSQPCLVFG